MFKKMIQAKAYQFISATIRNGLVALGGYISGNELAAPDDVAVLPSLAPLLIGVIWSFARKVWPELKV